jgi:hypothetical protein
LFVAQLETLNEEDSHEDDSEGKGRSIVVQENRRENDAVEYEKSSSSTSSHRQAQE